VKDSALSRVDDLTKRQPFGGWRLQRTALSNSTHSPPITGLSTERGAHAADRIDLKGGLEVEGSLTRRKDSAEQVR
jgi:hypothetical protein